MKLKTILNTLLIIYMYKRISIDAIISTIKHSVALAIYLTRASISNDKPLFGKGGKSIDISIKR